MCFRAECRFFVVLQAFGIGKECMVAVTYIIRWFFAKARSPSVRLPFLVCDQTSKQIQRCYSDMFCAAQFWSEPPNRCFCTSPRKGAITCSHDLLYRPESIRILWLLCHLRINCLCECCVHSQCTVVFFAVNSEFNFLAVLSKKSSKFSVRMLYAFLRVCALRPSWTMESLPYKENFTVLWGCGW